jgi:hypothetical protein
MVGKPTQRSGTATFADLAALGDDVAADDEE